MRFLGSFKVAIVFVMSSLKESHDLLMFVRALMLIHCAYHVYISGKELLAKFVMQYTRRPQILIYADVSKNVPSMHIAARVTVQCPSYNLV